MTEEYRYFVLHKPRNVVSQFISSHIVPLLGSIDFPFPEGTHAIGRLDKDSEGLLLLTTDRRITRKLFSSVIPHQRQYLVQVKYGVEQSTLQRLQEGINILVSTDQFYTTKPCTAELVTNPSLYFQYTPTPYDNKNSSWILLTIAEGKFHQVRKMVAAVGHKCKRLIRVAIEDLKLEQLPEGGVRELKQEEFFRLLKLKQ